jgi:N-acetyl-1-D-myo-inositol-2-amino-2-deoxy-alpha-D-glucopyranoside deacetylase/mycothiol S-conjugate amidase
MSEAKTLVFFGAHPDDESFGMGATLAQYASAGVRVYYVCSTGGEAGTVDAEYMKGHKTIGELRKAELSCAARALGLAGTYFLGYRDSGMEGAADNSHPDALIMAPLEAVAGRMVRHIRELKPAVVITHDAGGSYGHPDHIATHQAAVRAFSAAGDPLLYPEAGPSFKPAKLYFGVRPLRRLKLLVRLMPLFGKDPRHFGRNGDIDLTRLTSVDYTIDAVVRLNKQAVEDRRRAAACHASQGGGRRRRGFFRILEFLENIRGPADYFSRACPPPDPRRREKDLFEGAG